MALFRLHPLNPVAPDIVHRFLPSQTLPEDDQVSAFLDARRQLSHSDLLPIAAQWLAGFLLLNGDMETGRAAALEAFPLSRALGNVNLMDSVDQLAFVAATQGDTAIAARLCGFADAYGRRYAISRYRITACTNPRYRARRFSDPF